MRCFATATGLAVMRRERLRVYFSGRVQGVGFRYQCQSVARGLPVAGHVRNLADGRVELVAEGEPDQLAAFLNAIEREMHLYITNIDKEVETPGDAPLVGFSIRH